MQAIVSAPIQFCIHQTPVSWRAHQGFGKRSFNPRIREKISFQRELCSIFSDIHPFKGPISLVIGYFLPAPKSLKNRDIQHVKRPDLDNLNKFFLDTMKGIVMQDDSQVVSLNSTKKYAQNDPCVICQVFLL